MLGRRRKTQLPSLDDLPKDNRDLVHLAVHLDHLKPDSPVGCPVGLPSVLRYLADEVPGGEALTEPDLTFVRTAKIGANALHIAFSLILFASYLLFHDLEDTVVLLIYYAQRTIDLLSQLPEFFL